MKSMEVEAKVEMKSRKTQVNEDDLGIDNGMALLKQTLFNKEDYLEQEKKQNKKMSKTIDFLRDENMEL